MNILSACDKIDRVMSDVGSLSLSLITIFNRVCCYFEALIALHSCAHLYTKEEGIYAS